MIGYDLDDDRLAQVVAAGGEAGADVADVVRSCDVIVTSLPSSSSWVQVAEHEILPHVAVAARILSTLARYRRRRRGDWPPALRSKASPSSTCR